jgi:hypothetical protein
MTTQRKLQILAFGILAIMGLEIEHAAARQCFWDGSSPICRGKCPRGYETVKVQACLNGFKVLCCEPEGFISQGQQGSKRQKECANVCAQCEGKPKGMVCAGVPYKQCMRMCLH